jgi:hypothetical protein
MLRLDCRSEMSEAVFGVRRPAVALLQWTID